MKLDIALEMMENLDDDRPVVKFEKIKKTVRSGAERQPASAAQFVHSQDDSRASFEFTYRASRHEQGWLLNSLGGFYERGWIADILRLVKGGKEASVYQCTSGQAVEAPILAAKVFRPRQFRNLKKDHLYRLDREVLDELGRPVVDLGMLLELGMRVLDQALQPGALPSQRLGHLGHLFCQFVQLQHGYPSAREFSGYPLTNKLSDRIILQRGIAAKRRFHYIAVKTWLTNW